MKKYILLIIMISINYYGQNKLNDPSIVAQHKRMVFESWGDFRPYPKYFMGVQTNFAYATVWGMWAPSRNRDYKDGPDIRPLKPNGLEVQRLVKAELQRKETENIEIQIDTLLTRNIQDFAHWTPVTVDADPLWLLYYKRMLRPLKDFPDKPQNFLEWSFEDEETYKLLLNNGTIDILQEKLDLLKEKYYQSRNMDMPRGKRFLMYHETLIEWRNFLQRLREMDKKTNLYFDYKKALSNVKSIFSEKKIRTDKEIVEKIMTEYKHKF